MIQEREAHEQQQRISAEVRQKVRESIKLCDEPPKGTDGVCEVVFRAPSSGQRVSRRFLKGDNLKSLYDFVRTLDDDTLGLEDCESSFELIKPTPRKVFPESSSVTL